MPLNGAGTASKPAGTTAVADTTIESAKFNSVIDDLYSILNTARPLAYGGTGATTAIAAQDALVTAGADIATGSTINLDTATGGIVKLTGTTTCTAITLGSGKLRLAKAAGAFQLTAGASLIVNGSTSTNYTTAAGDLLICIGEAAGVVRVWAVRSAGELGAVIHALTGKTTPVDADELGVSDSAASNVGKKVTFTQAWTNYFKAKADALYQPLKAILTTLGNLANTAGVLTNNGSGTLSWAAAASAGQPIPSTSALAVGTFVLALQSSGGSLADGATTGGANIRPAGGSTSGVAQSGTWTNVHGSSVANNQSGYFVRTA